MRRLLRRGRYEWTRRLVRLRRAALRGLPAGLVERLADAALRFRQAAHEALRQRAARRSPEIEPRRTTPDGRRTLARSVLERHAPWSGIVPATCGIPGMLTPAERQYYSYLPDFYAGEGEVVELGPWLGLSTWYLLQGLLANPRFAGRRLHVFDDFTWRSSWMDKWLAGTDIAAPGNHETFQPLFEHNMAGLRDRIEVRRRKIADHDGNEGLPPLEWTGGPIELLVVDCGRPLPVNEAWYRVLAPWFIPDRTLVVMQDWQNHKRVPEVHWENTKLFTDGREGALELIHEVDRAGIATFLFRNPGKPHA